MLLWSVEKPSNLSRAIMCHVCEDLCGEFQRCENLVVASWSRTQNKYIIMCMIILVGSKVTIPTLLVQEVESGTEVNPTSRSTLMYIP